MHFGFFPAILDDTAGDVTIRTLDRLDEKIREVMERDTIEGDWCYAPLQRSQAFTGDIRILPYPSRVFALPKTHTLEYAPLDDADHLRFLIQCFGFFVGMRMSDTEAGFIDATPVKPHKASDMVWLGNSLMKAIALADRFWCSNVWNPRIHAALRGVIHSYFLAATPTLLDFERFIYLYVALEGCHYTRALILRQTPARRTSHRKRVADLCSAYGIAVPFWADPAASLTTDIVRFRNETLHEGLFFDEPLGFQVFGGNSARRPEDEGILLEMSCLISRVILALLGMEKSQYVTSPIDTRQMIGVRI